MRKLKFHEKKPLKKVNFLEWKRERGHRENLIMQHYHISGRDDYKKYSGLCHMVQKLVNILKQMDPKDPFLIDMTDKLLEKLRSLSTVLVRLKFAEHLKEALSKGIYELVQRQLQTQLSL